MGFYFLFIPKLFKLIFSIKMFNIFDVKINRDF